MSNNSETILSDYSPKQAETRLGIKRTKLYTLMRDGELPGVYMIGSHKRIPRQSVEDYIKRQQAKYVEARAEAAESRRAMG
jgi:excisionase family DNA binding protein